MQQAFIHKSGYDDLTVFFSGWGMDENPFRDFRAFESDVMLCFDYVDLGFDERRIEPYAHVRVVAWSLGVWAASVLQTAIPRLGENAVAVNGTPYPVDDSKGIPPEIFNGTLQGLSPASLARFDRRMCADAKALADYNLVHPKRDIQSLADELSWIGRESAKREISPKFRRAYVGKRDAVFSCENQMNAWRGICPVEVVDASHYDRERLRTLVCGGGE